MPTIFPSHRSRRSQRIPFGGSRLDVSTVVRPGRRRSRRQGYPGESARLRISLADHISRRREGAGLKIPGGFTDPRGIATGANGDIWFAEHTGQAVGRLRLQHAVHTVGVCRSGTWYLRNSLSSDPSTIQLAAGGAPLRFRLR